MRLTFDVDNLRRSGCANIIELHFRDHPNIHAIEVDIDNGQVRFETDRPEIRYNIAHRLKKLGYPEKGSIDGIESVRAKASSLVSCAMGKINNRTRNRD